MLNRRLVDRFSLRNLLRTATSCALVFALLLLLFNIGNFRSLWAVVFPMLLIFSTNGIVAACSTATALNSIKDSMTGSATALLALSNTEVGSFLPSSSLFFQMATPKAMVVIIFLAILASTLMAWIARK